MPATTTNKRRAFSQQGVELTARFLTLHIVLETRTVTICLEGLDDVAAFYWLTSMVENNP
jgi:hypothetical protein